MMRLLTNNVTTSQLITGLALTGLVVASTNAFVSVVPTTTTSSFRKTFVHARSRRPVVANMVSSQAEDEIAKLRAAAAKAREDAERLSQELGRTNPVAQKEPTPVIAKKSFDEIKEQLPVIMQETDLIKQAAAWSALKQNQSIQQYGSANLRTFPVSLQMLEQRTGLTATAIFGDNEVNLDDFKYATLYVAGFSTVAGIGSLAFLPPNIGPTLCYLFALIPIVFLGIGSTAPGVIAEAIASLRGTKDTSADGITVTPVERRCRHEAAHFCCGYWCGLPVSSYTIQANGVCQVEFAISSSQYSQTEVAALAVTALSGLVGEVKQYKNAVGASEDLVVLDRVFRQSKDFIGAAAQQDLTRWGALTAAMLLQQNKDKYEKVVDAFTRQAPLEECISILES